MMRHRGEVRFDPAGGFFRRWAWRVTQPATIIGGPDRVTAWAFPRSTEGRTFTRRSAVERAASVAAAMNDEERQEERYEHEFWEVV